MGADIQTPSSCRRVVGLLTEPEQLQLLQVDAQLEGCSLALTAPDGQSGGQACGGRSQEWILQHQHALCLSPPPLLRAAPTPLLRAAPPPTYPYLFLDELRCRL